MSYVIYDEIIRPTHLISGFFVNEIYFRVRFNIIVRVVHHLYFNTKTIYYNNLLYKESILDNEIIFRINGKRFKIKFGKFLCPQYIMFYHKLF